LICRPATPPASLTAANAVSRPSFIRVPSSRDAPENAALMPSVIVSSVMPRTTGTAVLPCGTVTPVAAVNEAGVGFSASCEPPPRVNAISAITRSAAAPAPP
jgi:hypothetical protein